MLVALAAAVALGVALAALPGAAWAQDGAREAPGYDRAAGVEVRSDGDSAAATRRDLSAQRPFAALSRSAVELRDSIVSLARAQIGRRYVLGGSTPSRGFDCSGLVKYIVAALHIAVPRTAAQQARVGVAVPRDTSRLLPGDLVTFGRGKRASHIGIYVGNGRFVHASTKAGRVIETDLLRARAPGIKPWRGVRRLVLSDSAVAGDSSGRN